jgi:hypothetical protein
LLLLSDVYWLLSSLLSLPFSPSAVAVADEAGCCFSLLLTALPFRWRCCLPLPLMALPFAAVDEPLLRCCCAFCCRFH